MENDTSHGGWGDFFVRNRAPSVMRTPGKEVCGLLCRASAQFKCQMSWLYWAMVRSLEKKPLLAVLMSIFLDHSVRSS